MNIEDYFTELEYFMEQEKIEAELLLLNENIKRKELLKKTGRILFYMNIFGIGINVKFLFEDFGENYSSIVYLIIFALLGRGFYKDIKKLKSDLNNLKDRKEYLETALLKSKLKTAKKVEDEEVEPLEFVRERNAHA